jgi:hypothetical protein
MMQSSIPVQSPEVSSIPTWQICKHGGFLSSEIGLTLTAGKLILPGDLFTLIDRN